MWLWCDEKENNKVCSQRESVIYYVLFLYCMKMTKYYLFSCLFRGQNNWAKKSFFQDMKISLFYIFPNCTSVGKSSSCVMLQTVHN